MRTTIIKNIVYLDKSIVSSWLIIVLIISQSCNDVLEPEPIGLATIDAQFTSPEGAITVVNGIYEVLPGIYEQWSGYFSTIEHMADDMFTVGAADNKGGWYDVSDSGVRSIWSDMYTGIQRANVVLDRIGGVEFNANDKLKNQLKGEAHFLRAYYYFHLVRLFGAVPITIHEIKQVDDAKIPRSSSEDVYELIIDDLNEAITLLPDNYDDSGLGQQPGRVTEGSAKGLLAYVHLTIEDWKKAAELAGDVIQSNNYELLTIYGDNFNGSSENGSESIFEVQFDGVNANFRYPYFLAPPNNIGVDKHGGMVGAVTDENLTSASEGNSDFGFFQAFEEGDLRKEQLISQYGRDKSYFGVEVEGEDYLEWFIAKYITFTPSPNPNNLPILRLADMYLIRAEALNELGVDLEVALSDLNKIRQRAGLDPLSAEIINDKPKFRNLIRNERRIELAFEAKRFYDLNRWGIWEDRLTAQGVEIIPEVKERIISNPMTGKPKLLLPIPQEELNNNPKATQNPGY